MVKLRDWAQNSFHREGVVRLLQCLFRIEDRRKTDSLILVYVAEGPVLRLFFAAYLREVAIFFVPSVQPMSVGAVFAVIPRMVVLVLLVVVLSFFPVISMGLALTATIAGLKSRRHEESCAQQK